MFESKPSSAPSPELDGADTHPAASGSASGALAVAGLTTTLVIALWFAFYFLIFVPRVSTP